MQGHAWVALLRHIPSEQHSKLMLVTVAGTEISLQSILRIDHEFVAIKGRLSGSQEQGRLFFIPYQNIDYFGFQHPVKDEDYHQLFDNLVVPAPALTAPAQAALPLASPAAHVEPAVAEAPCKPDSSPALPSSGPVRTPLPIKSEVLERFRSRVGGGSVYLPPGSP